jgi:5-methylcytosine-specific restriction endonuclease McrA
MNTVLATPEPLKEEDFQYFPQDDEDFPEMIFAIDDFFYKYIDDEEEPISVHDEYYMAYVEEYEPDWEEIESQEGYLSSLDHKYKRVQQRLRAKRNRYKKRLKPQKSRPYTPGLYPKEWTYQLRWEVRARDNYECQICELKQEKDSNIFHVHHIDYNKQNCKKGNLITLCPSCHVRTNHNRPQWIKRFKRGIK